MFKLVLTGVGTVLLFGSGLLLVERRVWRRWLWAGGLLLAAGVCLAIGKGISWLVLALVGAGALAYGLSRLDSSGARKAK